MALLQLRGLPVVKISAQSDLFTRVIAPKPRPPPPPKKMDPMGPEPKINVVVSSR